MNTTTLARPAFRSTTRSARFLRRLAMAPVAAALCTILPAHALTITPTFTGSGYDATAQATIANAIAYYQTTFTDNISVSINFINSGAGLGSSSQSFYNYNYGDYQTALRGDGSSLNDATALAHIPNVSSGTSPVPGTDDQVWLTRSNAWAVGLTDVAAPTTGFDATIDLNLAEMNFTRSSIDPNKYDLQGVAMHEINEVLGTTSYLPDNTSISPLDLFRYNAAGARTFTTSGDDAYFSIDGTTQLARFNQDASGDYGDFWSVNGGNPYQIQDAFSTPGVYANMGVETTMLDVVGYTLAVPEPETYLMMLAGLGLVGFAVRRRSV